jgi:hypothetical protein
MIYIHTLLRLRPRNYRHKRARLLCLTLLKAVAVLSAAAFFVFHALTPP